MHWDAVLAFVTAPFPLTVIILVILAVMADHFEWI